MYTNTHIHTYTYVYNVWTQYSPHLRKLHFSTPTAHGALCESVVAASIYCREVQVAACEWCSTATTNGTRCKHRCTLCNIYKVGHNLDLLTVI